ncbi:hypothetical protein TWF751_007545 [Orbilia oligospora]|nr:hypothetical protein TWF751_007545 [Orbilia oligospora]
MQKFRAAKSALEAILQDGDVEFAVLEEQRTLFMCQLEVSFDVVNRCMQNFKESNNADLQLTISASEQFFSTYHSKRIKDPEFSYSFVWKVIYYYLLPIETLYHQTNGIEGLQAAIDIYQSVCSNPSQEDIGILLYYQGSLFAISLIEASLLSSSRIVTRITAAIHASYLFTIGSELDEAVRFAELSAKLFPLMPSRQLDQREQIHVRKFSWVASCSASFTLFGGGGEYNAIRVLELGRGAITGLRLEMRSDLTELKLHHPDMAAQFEKFREILDSPLSISTDSTFADDDQTSSVDENRLQELRHCTNIELNKLIDQIRLLPNFGPIIIINVSWFSSEAILIETTSIRSIDLPKLNKSDLDKKIKGFQAALCTNGTSQILGILMWLWNVAAGPILDSLGFVAPPSEDNDWPHVWWIPTGN